MNELLGKICLWVFWAILGTGIAYRLYEELSLTPVVSVITISVMAAVAGLCLLNKKDEDYEK